ncbi:MAG: AraC family transcriptional regulator [Verrucomicrobia bacterium]|nr:AraC family transcriptional regulator [Verrucomicrobiota bacterium]
MEFVRRPPHPALACWVECLWSLRAPAPAGAAGDDRILPDGCMELVVNLRAPVESAVGDAPFVLQPRAVLAGQLTRCLRLRTTGPTEMVSVRFRPGGTTPFFRFSMDELADQELALEHLGAPWHELEERLQEARGPTARLQVLERCLLRAFGGGETRDPLQRAVGLLRGSAGREAIGQVARRAGLSPRQLERRFQREIGLGPKQFARIARFQELVRLLPAGEPRWAEAAYAAGLTDQAHLVREFRAFTGLTPTAWLAEQAPLGEAMRT